MTDTVRPALSRRAFGAATTAALATAGLVGCSSNSEEFDPADIPAEGDDDGASLTLWTRAPIEAQAKLLVDAYNASHENQVALTVVPNDDYVAKVGAAAGSDGLPDLFAADVVYVPSWSDQGLFKDLGSLVDGLDFADALNPGHMEAGTIDDARYAMPFVLDLSVLMWNKDLVREAGHDPEQAPATLEEFAQVAKDVQALGKEGVSGSAAALNSGGALVFTLFPSIWASGEEVLGEDGTVSLLDGEAAQSLYETWRDLFSAGVLAPGSADETGATWTAAFQQGQVGIQPYPATVLPALEFDAGVAGIPGVEGGVSTFVGGDAIGISKDSTKASQAWNFLSWMVSEEAQVEVLAKNGNVVSRSDLSDNQYAAEDPRLVTINEVAGAGRTPVAVNFQEAFNAASGPWLTLLRNQVIEGTDTLPEDNQAITDILSQ